MYTRHCQIPGLPEATYSHSMIIKPIPMLFPYQTHNPRSHWQASLSLSTTSTSKWFFIVQWISLWLQLSAIHFPGCYKITRWHQAQSARFSWKQSCIFCHSHGDHMLNFGARDGCCSCLLAQRKYEWVDTHQLTELLAVLYEMSLSQKISIPHQAIHQRISHASRESRTSSTKNSFLYFVSATCVKVSSAMDCLLSLILPTFR